MKILVVSKPNTSYGYHRLVVPYTLLHGKDGIEVDFVDILSPDLTIAGLSVKEFVKGYDWVVFTRMIHPMAGITPLIAAIIKDAGARIMLDLDDYWELPTNHVIYKEYVASGMRENTLESIALADVVTVTTGLLRSMVLGVTSPGSVSVCVLPNAINTSLPQFAPVPQGGRSPLRFGYLGSITHEHDVELMRYSFQKLWGDTSLVRGDTSLVRGDKGAQGLFSISLCGYSVYDGVKEGQPYPNMEKVMTGGYRPPLNSTFSLDENYTFPTGFPYQRVKYNYDLNTYATAYNLFDVSLAPLENNLFNRCKSELKMIEAGVMGKAIIVSNIYPYTNLITKKNCIAVSDNKMGWYDGMKKLIKNPRLAEDLSQQLAQDVKEKYDITKVNEKRLEILTKQG
jgi:glycosyltransferase involved in cell wall biosynthesis